MREIKFRAWIKDYVLMADVNFLNIDYKEIVVMIDENDYEFGCGEYELMQYTGLKDKNGREIYEGDVYVHNVQDYVAGHPREINFIKPVTFEMGAFWVGDMLLVDAIENDSESKVIGNIYENPELLEEGEK